MAKSPLNDSVLRLIDFDEDQANAFVAEFVQEIFPGARFGYACVHASGPSDKARRVFRVRVVGKGEFALKFDPQAAQSGRIEVEYNWLRSLENHFQGYRGLGVVKPVYLAQSNAFHVTEYVEGVPAQSIISGAETESERVYSRAARWLSALHDFAPARAQAFWPEWMLDALDRVTHSAMPAAERAVYAPMILRMHDEAEDLTGLEERKTLTHGSFAARNLLLTDTESIGLDMSTETEKLAVYDMVDFLKSDILLDGTKSGLEPSGISSATLDSFFSNYGENVKQDIFDYCMRGRLLIDWLKISNQNYANSAYHRQIYDRLEARLRAAFRG